MANDGQWKAIVASKQLEIDKLKRKIKEMEDDSARQRSTSNRKRIKGLNRVTAAINDLSIYGIFYGNYPELVKVLEHAKDHVKAELKSSKERLESFVLSKRRSRC